jgi:tetratricopeptide (TPR) repeat protein
VEDDKTPPRPLEEPATRAPRDKLGGEKLVVAFGVPVLLLVILFGMATWARKQTQASSDIDAGPPPRRERTLADLPPPACNAAAAAEVRSARGDLRKTGQAAARAHLDEAVKRDPDCAEAHLRLAMLLQWSAPQRAAEAFARALAQKTRLDARDRELLEALEPSFATPANDAETRKRLRALAAMSHSRDAEILAETSLREIDEPLNAIGLGKQSVRVDPKYAGAYRAWARAAARAGELGAADDVLEKCAAELPEAIDCVHERMLIHRRAGLCEAMEREAKSVLASPSPPGWTRPLLASAIATRGGSRAAVTEVLAPRWADPAFASGWEVAHERARVAILYGDFKAARTEIDAVAKAVASSTELAPHAAHALLEMELLDETGDRDGAARVAQEQAARLGSWSRPPRAFADAWGAGWFEPRIASFVPQERDHILGPWRKAIHPGELDEMARWAYGEALIAKDEDQAETATRMPKRGTRPLANAWPAVDYLTGRTQLGAKRAPIAAEHLKMAVARCDAVEHPFEHVRARERLALAYEKLGDDAKACEEYRAVVDRWGAAKPESVTAKRAQERVRALGCAK